MLAGDSGPFGTYSDAARRVADTHNLHLEVQGIDAQGQYFAAKLEDGTTDGELYPTRRDAIRHQKGREREYAFCCVQHQPMTYQEAAAFLGYHRHIYSLGHYMPDPDAPDVEPVDTITLGGFLQ